MLKKGLFGGAIVIIAIVAGFIFLLRGCLSGYDERSAITPVLYFEKDGKAVSALWNMARPPRTARVQRVRSKV